jgi:hypothetical protein
MADKLLNVTVKRKGWRRGKGGYTSKLRREDGLMCCLGFACRAAHISAKNIAGIADPAELVNRRVRFPTSLSGLIVPPHAGHPHFADITPVCDELIRTNDDEDITDRKREQKLARLGKKAGIAFTFVD